MNEDLPYGLKLAILQKYYASAYPRQLSKMQSLSGHNTLSLSLSPPFDFREFESFP